MFTALHYKASANSFPAIYVMSLKWPLNDIYDAKVELDASMTL